MRFNLSKFSNKKRTFVIVSMAIFLMIASLVIVFSILDKANSQRMAAEYLESVAEGVTKTVDSWVEEKKKMLDLISELPETKLAMEDTCIDINERLGLILDLYDNVENIFLADLSGEIISGSLYSNIDSINLCKLDLWKNFEERSFQTYLDTYVCRSQKTGKLTFILIKGVFSNQNQLLGYVGFTINWDKFIKKFIIPVKVGKTGYLGITDTTGRNIGHHDVSLTLMDLFQYPWMQKLINEKNGFQSYHFKNEDKLMAFRQSKETGWIINTSINEDELIGDTIRVRNSILIVSVVMLVVFLFMIGYLDMFKLQAAERNLIESERNFKLLFERGNDGIFIHKISKNGDPDNFTMANSVFLEIFDCTLPQLLTSTPLTVFGTSCDCEYFNVLHKIIHTKHHVIETELLVNDRKTIMEFKLFLIENNNEYSVMGFVRDITERIMTKRKLKEDRDILNEEVKERTKELLNANATLRSHIKEKDKIAQALTESEVRYRSLIERANDGIMLIRNQRIHFANKKMESLLSYVDRDLIDLPFEAIFVKKDRKWVMRNHETRLKGEFASNIFETKLVSSKGLVIDVEINAGIINYEGEPEDFIFVRDITLRKKNEEEKRIQNEQLIQTDKLVALGTLVSGVAHEINNPNNAIMLNSPIIKDVWYSAKPILEKYQAENGDFIISGMPFSFFKNYYEDIIGDIEDCSEKIKNIVEDLKNFAKPDSGLVTDDLAINEVIRSSVKLISSQLLKATDDFSVDLSPDMPSVKGNFVRLEQVMVNLLQNACHATKTHNGKISVCSSYSSTAKSISVIVKDEGCGISEANIKQIFNPFFTTKREQGGTGLGLSVSLRIVKEHNGDLTFHSKEGVGTEVIFKLPVTI